MFRQTLFVFLLCSIGGAAVAEGDVTVSHPDPKPKPDTTTIDGASGVTDKNVMRYQAIALPKPNSGIGDRLMVLDTQTGDVWQWWDNDAQHVGRTGVTYMGRLKPGSKPGETIIYQRFDARK